MESYNAFDQVALKRNPKSPHRALVAAEVKGTGEAMNVVLTFPLAEIQKARPGTGQRHSVGFSFAVEFTLPDEGGTFVLSSAWVTPNTVTRRSCIASRKAACVRGVARLISSASRTFAKIGPR